MVLDMVEQPKNMKDGRVSLGVAWSAYHQLRPSNNPSGDLDMAHLPQDSQTCSMWQTSVT